MDGTLYRADAELFYGGFVRHLAARLKNGRPLTLLAEYERWRRGDSPFLGDYLYDVRRRWLVSWQDSTAVAAYDPRNGRAVDEQTLAWAYRDGPPPSRLIGLGDGWTQLGCAAQCYGASLKDISAAYDSFQEEVIADPPAFGIVADPYLVETLRLLWKRGYLLGLVTMSSGEAVTGKLRALGVADSFHAVLEGVRKPEGSQDALRRLSEMCGTAVANWLVIGDNPLNDLAPARELGLPTILVNQAALHGEMDADVQAGTLGDCLQLLTECLPALAGAPTRSGT
jgi:FMN phosphatase YigB (HAD superfamily)